MDVEIVQEVRTIRSNQVVSVKVCCDDWKSEFGVQLIFSTNPDGSVTATPLNLISPVTGKQVRRSFKACPFCETPLSINVTVKEVKPAGPEQAAEK